MQIVSTKVSRRRTPPGACVELASDEGGTIEIELKGDEFEAMSDAEIIDRAKATIKVVTASDDGQASSDAGVDQTRYKPRSIPPPNPAEAPSAGLN